MTTSRITSAGAAFPTASSATWGLRWTGSRPWSAGRFGWTLEAARQRDHARNPLRFSHAYWLAEPALTLHGVTVRAGWEHLGGNGTHALQAPLATLHAFNGWADKFTTTPAAGLDDRYLGFGGNVGRERAGSRVAWQLAWHDYRAARGDARYGREWDASLGLPLAKGVTALFKLADYRAGNRTCATCHAYVDPDWVDIVGPPSMMEEDMLDFAFEVKPNSRLSCQIKVRDELDGLIMRVPSRQG